MKIVIFLWVTATLLLILSPLTFSETIGIGGLKKNRMHHKLRGGPAENSQIAEADKNIPLTPGISGKKPTDLPDIPIYFKGWIKYLHYTERDVKKAKAFYKNLAFDVQSKKGMSAADLAATDEVKYNINFRADI